MKPVGILGGMGPEATILLMQKVLKAVPARDDSEHVPLIVHQNPQVPSRIAALIDGGGTDPGPVLAGMARDLNAAGAQALAMPCNTAHHYAPAVKGATGLPFLNMIDLTATALVASGARRIGMLASPATRLVGVFDESFAEHGLQPVWTQDEDAMLAMIRAVKAGKGQDDTGPEMAAQAQHLLECGADHLLIACTELSLLTAYLPKSAPWFDSLDCLTTAIVDFAKTAVP
ncbi:amino acid racemase [uncultured Roseovarius sp.]|uniref:aspartate/glutamate racemase family protein n=1 Tax=uncultured Roseovarius sp. TaxID=293344 RepID=UPI00262C615C|nr:amino acid racemase [uncultured Roseovarius sp.]